MALPRTSSFNRRNELISGLSGPDTSVFQSARDQRKQSFTNRNDLIGQMGKQAGGTFAKPTFRGTPIQPQQGGASEFDRFFNAIAQKESGGNYGAVNRDSGALGKYQIMPSNIPAWSRAALGRQISAQEFLRSPQLQEQIARHHLQGYFNQFGAGGAAAAWYGGPRAGQRYVAGQGGNKSQGRYPTINAYAAAILRMMGQG